MTLKVKGSPSDLASFLAILGGQNRIDTKIDSLIQTQETIIMTLEEEKALLTQVDDATTKIGTNVQRVADNDQVISTTVQTISTEMDVLLAQNSGAIPTEVANQLTSIRDRMAAAAQASQLSSDALDAQVPVLQAIATKGAGTPVPVPVPPVPVVA